jgi:hypothetical protein
MAYTGGIRQLLLSHGKVQRLAEQSQASSQAIRLGLPSYRGTAGGRIAKNGERQKDDFDRTRTVLPIFRKGGMFFLQHVAN